MKSFIYPFVGVTIFSLILHYAFTINLPLSLIGPALMLIHFFVEERFLLGKYWDYGTKIIGVIIPVVTLALSQADKKPVETKVIVEVNSVADVVSVKEAAPKRDKTLSDTKIVKSKKR